jgi:spore germination protein
MARVHSARRQAWLLALAAAALLSLAPAGAQAATPGLAVLGFQEEDGPLSRIDASAAALSTVGVDGVNLLPGGASVTAPGKRGLAQLARAHANGLKAILLIGNFDESIEDFNEAMAYALLGDPAHVSAVAAQLSSYVRAQGWDGISVDLESLAPRDTSGLVAFVGDLRHDLPTTAVVNVDVTNYTKAGEYRATGYDLSALGAAADEITLMAYDQHGPWEKHPGPVGALAWVRAGLAVVLKSIPAAKIDLGIAGYGYAWRPSGDVQLGDEEARALIASQHATAKFKKSVGEWTAKLKDGSTIWFSDARSYRLHAELALAEHLHGVAVWSLGLSDPLAVVSG